MAKQDRIEPINIITPEGRLSWPSFFKPTEDQNGKLKYKGTLSFDKKDPAVKELKRAIGKVMAAAHGPDPKKWPRQWKNPLRDGADRQDAEGFGPDVYFINASAEKTKPGVCDGDLIDLTREDQIYAGCYARFQVLVSYFDQQGSKGVRFVLLNVQKTRNGDPIGLRRKPQEVFTAIDNGDDDDLDLGDDLGEFDEYT